MRDRRITQLAIAVFALAALFWLAWWLRNTPSPQLTKRVPDSAEQDAGTAPHPRARAAVEPTDIKGRFLAADGVASSAKGAWPRFRGSDFDNICKDDTPLAERWPEGGPPLLWSVELGEGHAGPVILAGRVYVLDYDETELADTLRCLSLADGREIWRRWYRVQVKRNHGMSRTVPAATEQYVVSIGPKCHVMCVDAVSGEFRWGIDLVREFGTTVPLWYTGQCPLIDKGIAVIAPGGSALMLGVDCETGRVVWQTPNPDGWKMSHSSIVPATLAGRRVYVYCAVGGVAGVAADADDRGRILWKTAAWNHSVIAPSPVPIGQGRLLLTAGYGAGSMVLQVSAGDTGCVVEPIATLDKSVFACEQQTPIMVDGHLYSVLPNDAGALKRQLVCYDPSAGVLCWNSGKEHRFGLGPYLLADGKLFVLDDAGTLSLVKLDPREYVLLSRARILAGRDAWGPMALVGGRLLVRDWKRMVCLDVSASAEHASSAR